MKEYRLVGLGMKSAGVEVRLYVLNSMYTFQYVCNYVYLH